MSPQDFQTPCYLDSRGINSSSAPCESTLHLEDELAHSLRLQSASGKQLPSQSCADDLPLEIIHLIFERAIPPYSLLDTSLAAGPHSPWCKNIRLLKSITLVSHSWYNVGVPFLYENICIRRTAQLERLHQALARSSESLRQLYLLVKSMELQCFIPKDFSSYFSADLDAIIRLCPSLSKLAYITAIPLPQPAIRPANLVPQITHLRLDGSVCYEVLVTILHAVRESLFALQVGIDYNESLELGGEPAQTTPDDTGSPPTFTPRQVSLPSLQTLSVTFPTRTKELRVLKDHWVMPLLQRATIYAYSTFAYSSRSPTDDLEDEVTTTAIVSFLTVHGHDLHFLHIGFPYLRFQPTAFQSLLEHCPLLERLVIHPSTFERIYWKSDNLFHPNLRWIDFTHYFRDYAFYRHSSLCLTKTELPGLVGVRHICNLPGYYFNWLDEFHPPHDAELLEDFTLDVFDSRLVCRGILFHWNFEPIVGTGNSDGTLKPAEFGSFSEWKDDGEYTDSDYVDTSDDDDSDTDSSSSCSFASGDGDAELLLLT